MTPTDLLFVLCFAIVIVQVGHWMREWEGMALTRLQIEEASRSLAYFIDLAYNRKYEYLGYEIGETMHELINAPKYTGPENWIPAKFCQNEYKINEIENRAFIDALWPKLSNRETDS